MKNKLQKTTTKLTRQLTLLIMTLLLTVGAAQAADYTVNSTSDSGTGGCNTTECTLREAIAAANATTVDDVINFAIPTTDAGYDSTTGIYTITLSGTQLEIQNNGSLTINGTGADKLTVSGNRKSGVFKIHYLATAEIKNLTISDGAASSGGGIFNGGGTVTLTDSTVSGNSTSGFGGGIYNFKSGRSSSSGTLTLTNSTVSGNTTPRNGGGIYHESGIFTLTNSTVSGNSAGYGSGIYNRGNARIINSTISGNSVGISNFTGTLTLINSIIANSTSSDCNNQYGTVNASYSLIEDGRCITEGVNNNLKGDPILGPLQDNGGPTETHALLPGSIAIDAGNSTLTTDQRGAFRPVDDPNSPNGTTGNLADIGAFEVQAPTAASVTISGRVLSSAAGRGLQRAIIHLTDQNGNMRIARTNSFGYYRFDDVEVGQSLIIIVYHKQYQFNPQVVTINNAVDNLDFIALPSAPALKAKGLDYLFDRKFN